MDAATSTGERLYGTERLGAVSDGLFAILLTLLVLELKVPELPGGFAERELAAALAELIPNAVAWAVSFLLIARFWVTHHSVLATLRECHRGTIALNFLLLALLSLVPFASALIGTYEFDPIAIGIFSALIASVGLALGLFCRHVEQSPHLHEPGRATDLGWHWRYNAVAVPAVAACAVLLAFAYPAVALLVWIGEPALAFLLARGRAPLPLERRPWPTSR